MRLNRHTGCRSRGADAFAQRIGFFRQLRIKIGIIHDFSQCRQASRHRQRIAGQGPRLIHRTCR